MSCKLLYVTLEHTFSPVAALEPRPAHVKEGEEEIVTKTSSDESLKAWLMTSRPVPRQDGIDPPSLKAAIKNILVLEGAYLKIAATEVGLDIRGAGSVAGTRVAL